MSVFYRLFFLINFYKFSWDLHNIIKQLEDGLFPNKGVVIKKIDK